MLPLGLGFLRWFWFGCICRAFDESSQIESKWGKYPVCGPVTTTQAPASPKAPQGDMALLGTDVILIPCKVYLLPTTTHVHTREEERTGCWGRAWGVLLWVRWQVVSILWPGRI